MRELLKFLLGFFPESEQERINQLENEQKRDLLFARSKRADLVDAFFRASEGCLLTVFRENGPECQKCGQGHLPSQLIVENTETRKRICGEPESFQCDYCGW